MLRDEFRALVKAKFGLEWDIDKQKLAYDMVMWNDGTDGDVGGAEAGHSHECSVPYIVYKGWAYAYYQGEWLLLKDGVCGWRVKGSTNPFPDVSNEVYISTW